MSIIGMILMWVWFAVVFAILSKWPMDMEYDRRQTYWARLKSKYSLIWSVTKTLSESKLFMYGSDLIATTHSRPAETAGGQPPAIAS